MRLEYGASTGDTNAQEALLHIPTLRPGDGRRRCGGRALRQFVGLGRARDWWKTRGDSRVAVPRLTESSIAAERGP